MKREVKTIYPGTNSRRFGLYKARRVIFLIFVVAFLTCGLVNLAVGGKPWFFYVFGAELLCWIVFLKWPLVDLGLMAKLTEITLSVIAYIIVLDAIDGFRGWSLSVACIICFSLSIVLSVYYFVGGKRANRNVVPLMITLFISVIACILYLTLSDILWEAIVLGAVSLVSIVICSVFYRKSIFTELKKKFHI